MPFNNYHPNRIVPKSDFSDNEISYFDSLASDKDFIDLTSNILVDKDFLDLPQTKSVISSTAFSLFTFINFAKDCDSSPQSVDNAISNYFKACVHFGYPPCIEGVASIVGIKPKSIRDLPPHDVLYPILQKALNVLQQNDFQLAINDCMPQKTYELRAKNYYNFDKDNLISNNIVIGDQNASSDLKSIVGAICDDTEDYVEM